MKRIVLIVAGVLVAFCAIAHAQQFYRSDFPPGKSVLVGFNAVDFPFSDLMKTANTGGALPAAFPTVLDANGFPNNGALAGTLIEQVSLPADYCAYHWVVDWAATTFGTNGSPSFTFPGPSGANPRITVMSGGQFVSSNSSPGSGSLQLYGVSSGAGSYGLTGGSVEFTFGNCQTNPNGSTNLTGGWLGGASESGITNFRLYRCLTTYAGYNPATPCTAAKAALNASPFGGFNPDFVNSILSVQPKWIRFLSSVGENNVLNALTKAAYRRPMSYLSYVQPRFIPSQFAGTISCTNNGTSCTTSGGAGDQLSATLAGATLTDGLLIQGQMQAATSTNAPCLSLNSGTCYNVFQEGGGPSVTFTSSISDGGGSCNGSSTYSGVAGTCMIVTATPSTLIIGATIYAQGIFATIVSQASGTAGSTGAYVISASFLYASASNNTYMQGIPPGNLLKNGYVSFTWDAALNAWEATESGLQDNTPIEVLAAICNTLNANPWYNIPGYLTLGDGSMAAIVSAFLTNLNPQLSLNIEFANEEWNNAYNVDNYANTYGLAIMGLSLSTANDSYYALRSKQYFDQAGAFTNPRVKGVLAGQFGGESGISNYLIRFMGQYLCWSTSQGCPSNNTTYQTNIGVAYNASPNRPADEAAYSSAAPYIQGGEFVFYVGPPFEPYRNTTYQTLTSNFALVAQAADDWVSGDSTDAFAIITADLTGSSSQLIPPALNLFTFNNPSNSNTSAGNLGFQFNAMGTFTGVATGTTTLTISNMTVNGYTTGKIYPDPVNGTVIKGGSIPNYTTIVAQQSGTLGQNGVYTTSAPLTINETVSFSGSYLQNLEQVAEALTATTGHTVSMLPYEGAWQLTGPTIADCNAIPGGELGASPKKYCGNISGPAGEVLMSGYKVGDTLSFAGHSLSGFTCTVATIAPDGTPLTCTVTNAGASGTVTSETNVALTGGSGFNIAADLTLSSACSTGSGNGVCSVTFYSQIVIEMLYAYMQSAAFQTITTTYYNELLAYPSTVAVAQSDYSGNIPFGNPWALILYNLYGPKLSNWTAFQQQNFLLKRDLNPASNDNTPMYLNEAA